MSAELAHVRMPFGHAGSFTGTLPAQRLFLKHEAPAACGDLDALLTKALTYSAGLPGLKQAVVPDDQVVIVLDRDTPQGAALVQGVWNVLSEAGVSPEHLHILQPASLQPHKQTDPRTRLPEKVAGQVTWTVHDPTEAGLCNYLATTAAGERIYLNQHLLNADLTILIGPVLADPLLGFRGTMSAVFPGLSDTDAMRRGIGQGHEELGANDVRPLRMLVDEIGWLLGTQFCIGVVPGPGDTVHNVFAGAPDAVLRLGEQAVSGGWGVNLDQRVELVIAAVEADASGHHWEQVARAADVARRLVEQGGRIVLLTELNEQPGPGLQLLRSQRSARAALRPLREQKPHDVVIASRIARAADWAHVSLASCLPDDLVEDLFLSPLHEMAEVQRLLDTDDATALLGSAQQVFVRG